MSITYTFPEDFRVAALRGVTATGGEFCNAQGRWQEADNAVRFAAPKIDGKNIVALCAGKPELETMLAAHLPEKSEAAAKKAADEAAFSATPRGQRKALVIAEYNAYSPDHFPGSAKWNRWNQAVKALEAFDAAHPELVAELKSEAEADRKAKYDALSDFVKNGS